MYGYPDSRFDEFKIELTFLAKFPSRGTFLNRNGGNIQFNYSLQMREQQMIKNMKNANNLPLKKPNNSGRGGGLIFVYK